MSKLGSVKSGVDVRRDEDCWMVVVRAQSKRFSAQSSASVVRFHP